MLIQKAKIMQELTQPDLGIGHSFIRKSGCKRVSGFSSSTISEKLFACAEHLLKMKASLHRVEICIGPAAIG
jgi:hypothetical protein